MTHAMHVYDTCGDCAAEELRAARAQDAERIAYWQSAYETVRAECLRLEREFVSMRAALERVVADRDERVATERRDLIARVSALERELEALRALADAAIKVHDGVHWHDGWATIPISLLEILVDASNAYRYPLAPPPSAREEQET